MLTSAYVEQFLLLTGLLDFFFVTNRAFNYPMKLENKLKYIYRQMILRHGAILKHILAVTGRCTLTKEVALATMKISKLYDISKF